MSEPFSNQLQQDLRNGEVVGAAIALALLAAVYALLPKHARKLARQPAVMLAAHTAARILMPLTHPDTTLHEVLVVGSVLLLLASIGRSGVLLVFDIGFGRRLSRPLPQITRDLVQGIVYVFVGLAALHAAGIALGSILTTSALITAVIGLSLQETLGNLFAGLAIQVQRPFDVGDWIQFESDPKRIGRVLEINWRATKVQTLDDVEIIVPNGTLGKAAIVNHSKPTAATRRSVYLSVPYGVPPRSVHAAVLAAVQGAPGVSAAHQPNIVTSAFNDSGIEYWLRFWTTDFGRRDVVDGEVRDRIWYALSRASIEFAFPTRNVFLHEVSDDTRERAKAARRGERISALRSVDFLSMLSADELERLADLAQSRLYTAGEVIVKAGDASGELFIVARGAAKVLAPNARGEFEQVGDIGAGKFFGEMALMTGEPRNATVIAESESELIAIGHEAFKATLDSHPSLAETMSRVLAERQARLQAHAAAGADDPREITERSHQLLSRIRSFFAL